MFFLSFSQVEEYGTNSDYYIVITFKKFLFLNAEIVTEWTFQAVELPASCNHGDPITRCFWAKVEQLFILVGLRIPALVRGRKRLLRFLLILWFYENVHSAVKAHKLCKPFVYLVSLHSLMKKPLVQLFSN